MIFSSDKLGYIFLGILGIIFLKNYRKYRDMFLVSVGSAVVARYGLVAIIRFFYHHPRPFLVLQNVRLLIPREAEYSFPSGHASFYFALATGVYLYNKKSGYVYLTLTALIGFARIFAGVHWPYDILGGATLGILTALVIQMVYNKMIRDILEAVINYLKWPN